MAYNTESSDPENRQSLITASTPLLQKSARAMANNSNKNTSAHKRPQIFAALTINLGALAFGTACCWSSPALPSLRTDTSFGEPVSGSDESWIGSAVPLGAALGSPIAGILMESIGRKGAMLVLTVPFVMAWGAIFLATSVTTIIIGRFVTGICAGGYTIVCPIFVGEISDEAERGYLVGGFEILESIGILLIFIVGTFLPWRFQAIVACSIPATMLLLLLFIPESPRYLLNKGNRAGAARALARYHGLSKVNLDVQSDLEQLAHDQKETTISTGAGANNGALTGVSGVRPAPRSFATMLSSVSIFQLFKYPTIKPISLALILIVINELSGIDIVKFYTVDLFESAGVSIDSYYSTVALGVVQLVGAISAASLADRCGRRFLLLLSESFVIISLALLTLFFLLKKCQYELTMTYLQWLPLVSLVIYIFAYVIGLGTVIHMLMGEILPNHVKGLASVVITISEWVLGFGITKSYESTVSQIGDASVFGLFTLGSCVGLFYIYFMVPETSGKTLEEIQQGFGVTNRQVVAAAKLCPGDADAEEELIKDKP